MTDDQASHVAHTMAFVLGELNLRRLIALSHGRARPGRAAFELIAPILCRDAPKNWAQLTSLGLAPREIIDAGERAVRVFERLPRWAAEDLDQALDALCVELDGTRRDVDAALSVLVLSSQTGLPLAPVLEALGQSECIARLHDSTRAYRACQMVG
ncbi:hypothetical protein DZC73_20225 [Albitalea terrae]|uniref:Aminoacyl-tRNA synthetase class I anticodon-binding domain-containing protein n=1 Tax=Piscinibacter terrae TaxID=2496871 RepID=A0A3N7HKM1_9BURK|nr:hypothetical protein DZC73_20225 [Albitalea terrae]